MAKFGGSLRARPAGGARGQRPKSVQRTLGSIVLAFESFVLFFATLVAFGFDKDNGPLIFGVGLSLSFILIATPAILGSKASYIFGWFLQFVMMATALWVPLMWVVGIIFLGLWGWGMLAGLAIDRAKQLVKNQE